MTDDRRILVLMLFSFVGCQGEPPCSPTVCPTTQPAGSPDVYQDEGDPFLSGPLTVQTINIATGADGAPTQIRIHAPTEAGIYPVVVFQHGFMSHIAVYSQMLNHVASHGFVVVAPQMYEPGLAAMLGDPTARHEATLAECVLDWLPGHLETLTGVSIDHARLGMAGHSRGGKIVWLVLADRPTCIAAVAGLDPTDGRGGPLNNQPRALDTPIAFTGASLILGAGIGGVCAPQGENHEAFFAASPSPAWHVIALDYGHGDMLDPEAARASAVLCGGGPDPDAIRGFTAGLLVAFFRVTLQGDPTAQAYLTDIENAPVRITVETK